jgi:NAD(P)-dependent dehydrogenase (short-subunit alcohol dehydrogenase family)
VSGRLAAKVAVVAGAGSIAVGWSNGKATAVLFAREGAKVFAHRRFGCIDVLDRRVGVLAA